MEVAISELRSNLKSWVEQARAGQNVVITDRGLPIARLLGIDSTDLIEQLERDGTITRARAPKRRTATGRKRASASGPVAGLVGEMRQAR